MAKTSQQKLSTKRDETTSSFIVYRVLTLARILSLDVVLGACVSAQFIAEIFGARVEAVTILALGICVWLIYTADHLWDAYQLQHPAHTVRHSFHQRYFQNLVIAWLVVAALGAITVFRIPPIVFKKGLLLSGGVAIYFVINRFVRFNLILPKEILAALLYSLGIFLPIAVQVNSMSLIDYRLFGQFFLLALANLTLISWYEFETDQLDSTSSLATQYGKIIAQRISVTCILFSLGIATWEVFNTSTVAQSVVIAMGLILASIWVFPVWYDKNERYRWVADSIFFIPPILYLLAV